MPALISFYMAGWDRILNDATVLCRWNRCRHHQSRTLMIKDALMINTSDSSGFSSPETCTRVDQTTQLVWAVNELPTGDFDFELVEVKRRLNTSCSRGPLAQIKRCRSSTWR